MVRFFATFTGYDSAENKTCGGEYWIYEVSLPVSHLLIDHSFYLKPSSFSFFSFPYSANLHSVKTLISRGSRKKSRGKSMMHKSVPTEFVRD